MTETFSDSLVLEFDVFFFLRMCRSSAQLQERRSWLAGTFCRAHCVQVSLLTVRSAAFPHLPLRRRTVGEAFKRWCSDTTNTGGIKAICSDNQTLNVSTKFLLGVHDQRLKRTKTSLMLVDMVTKRLDVSVGVVLRELQCCEGTTRHRLLFPPPAEEPISESCKSRALL